MLLTIYNYKIKQLSKMHNYTNKQLLIVYIKKIQLKDYQLLIIYKMITQIKSWQLLIIYIKTI